MKRPTFERLPNGNYLLNGTLEIEPPAARPAPLPPIFGRMKGADGDVVDVAVFADGTVVERMETPAEARAKLNARTLRRCGGRLDETYTAAWRLELDLDPHLKNIAAR